MAETKSGGLRALWIQQVPGASDLHRWKAGGLPAEITQEFVVARPRQQIRLLPSNASVTGVIAVKCHKCNLLPQKLNRLDAANTAAQLHVFNSTSFRCALP
mmetsp:Transcript_20306/g.48156  ORF Transcript_20306/g.48156 Transcript_20306/m.48156 type:complete len:101 (+) Transcript_20306:1607-1909(+)